MVKILIGLLAAAAIIVGGYFGFEFYVQHRVAGEVETAFAHIRASGGKASHGAVSFDRPSRTIKIADIVVETASQPPVSVAIASVTASGVDQPAAGRFAADTIEATGVKVDATLMAPADLRVAYQIPQLTVKGYSGPTGAPPSPVAPAGLYGTVVQQLIDVTATSISAPSMTGAMTGAAAPGGDFSYSGVAMRDIKAGKVAAIAVDRFTFTSTVPQPGKPEKITGELVDMAAQDLDLAAAAVILDPQKATDDKYYRVYRQITAGAYTIKPSPGGAVRIDGLMIEDVGVRPSKIQLPALLAALPPAGAAPPTPAQARELIEKAANVYEGIRIGRAELRGLSADSPQATFKLAAIRFSLDNGKTGEFAFEGLDGRTPQGPVKVARFALKSFDIAGMMRLAALYSNPAQRPAPDQAFNLIPLIEGAELKGLVAPYKNTGKPLTIDNISLDWGQFVGPIPSKARLTIKLAGPIDRNDPAQQILVATGLDKLAVDFDLGAGWTEAARSFALEPVTLDIDGLLKAQAKLSLGNVPREMFTTNPLQAMTTAAQIEAGKLELTLRDTGGVDFAVAQFARIQNISRPAAQQAIVDGIKAGSANVANNPGAMAIADALVSFVENPKTTLTLKLTPRGKVPALQLFQMLKSDPSAALSQFEIEAATAL